MRLAEGGHKATARTAGGGPTRCSSGPGERSFLSFSFPGFILWVLWSLSVLTVSGFGVPVQSAPRACTDSLAFCAQLPAQGRARAAGLGHPPPPFFPKQHPRSL